MCFYPLCFNSDEAVSLCDESAKDYGQRSERAGPSPTKQHPIHSPIGRNTKSERLTPMSIGSAVESIPEDTSIAYLKAYYSRENSGAHFESIEVDNSPPNRITASDLFAVTLLQTPIKAKAGVGILVLEANQISDLLSEITARPLESLTRDEFEQHLGSSSPALQLWDLLRRRRPGDVKWKVGPTRASKILARKRPHLIPITDSVVRNVIDQQQTDNDWQLWWEALTTDEYLVERAEGLRTAVGRPELSTLRVLDVLLWYSGTYGIHAK